MIPSLLTFMIIQLPMARCPLWIASLALGRRYAYQDMEEIRKGAPLNQMELKGLTENQKRIERILLRRWLKVMERPE